MKAIIIKRFDYLKYNIKKRLEISYNFLKIKIKIYY